MDQDEDFTSLIYGEDFAKRKKAFLTEVDQIASKHNAELEKVLEEGDNINKHYIMSCDSNSVRFGWVDNVIPKHIVEKIRESFNTHFSQKTT